jgi:hypothetical protein
MKINLFQTGTMRLDFLGAQRCRKARSIGTISCLNVSREGASHCARGGRAPRSESGSAVLVLIAFLVLMMMLCAATTRSVIWSRQEIGLIEKKQVARLATATNAPPASAKSAGSP